MILAIILIILISFVITYRIHQVSKEKVKQKIPAKQAGDYTLTASSTEWTTSDSWCSSCLSEIGHRGFMADVCNKCGEFGIRVHYGRSYRKIWNGESWIYQYKFKGSNDKLIMALEKRGVTIVYDEHNYLKYVLTDKPL
jgi:hypothetical protein